MSRWAASFSVMDVYTSGSQLACKPRRFYLLCLAHYSLRNADLAEWTLWAAGRRRCPAARAWAGQAQQQVQGCLLGRGLPKMAHPDLDRQQGMLTGTSLPSPSTLDKITARKHYARGVDAGTGPGPFPVPALECLRQAAQGCTHTASPVNSCDSMNQLNEGLNARILLQ
jgi:hypothetical protein